MKGKIAGVSTEIMLDSDSSISLLRQEIVLGICGRYTGMCVYASCLHL